jgi:hypothetical protein
MSNHDNNLVHASKERKEKKGGWKAGRERGKEREREEKNYLKYIHLHTLIFS